MAEKRDDSLGLGLLICLAILSATGPLTTDFYLPSFPEVLRSLHTNATDVQFTLTAFLIGLGLGQALWGPVSDRFGRRRPLLIGTSIALAAGILAFLAPTIQVLIAARFVQALAGSVGMVLARAVIADRLHGLHAARAMSLMQTIASAAPIIAPIVGGALAGVISWRGILAIVAGTAAVQVVAATTVRESLPLSNRVERIRYGHIARLLSRPAYLGYAGTVAFSYGLMMAYISSSSFVYQRVLDVPAWLYGLGFAANAVGLMGCGFVAAWLSRRGIHPARAVGLALTVDAVAAAVLLAIVLSPLPDYVLVVPLWFAVASIGFIFGNTNALALEHSRGIAGSGSGVIGGLQFLFGGVVSPLGSLAGDNTAVPFAIVMVCCGVLSLVSFALARAHVRAHPDLEQAYVR